MTEYSVLTPYGGFTVTWRDDDDSAPEYEGEQDAIDYFSEYLSTAQVTGRGGARLSLKRMEPADLYGFCESTEYGIAVAPTFDDLLDEANESDEAVLDSVSPADRIRIGARLAELSKQIASASGLERVRLAAQIADLTKQVTPAKEAS
jgi:hypothetical protein